MFLPHHRPPPRDWWLGKWTGEPAQPPRALPSPGQTLVSGAALHTQQALPPPIWLGMWPTMSFQPLCHWQLHR